MLIMPATRTVPQLPQGCSLALAPTYTFQRGAGTPSGKRFYLFHGLSDPTQWQSGPPLDLVNGLVAAGHDVVLATGVPDGQVCFFSNGGWQYRTRFIAMIDAMKASVEAANGPAGKNIVGGISYGGLHALMAAALTGWFDAWFAHVPVIYINALTEFSTVGEVRQFNPAFEVKALYATTGRLSWGTGDTRVNYQLAKALFGELGAGVAGAEYPGETHDTTEQNVVDILSWIAHLWTI